MAFTLEVDAYDTLYDYIESIRKRYTDNPDGEEIIADIEARIAELILAVHSSTVVVSKPLIDNIIKQMGSVDDICDDDPTSSDPKEDEPKERVKRQLYRDVDNSSIGGVCSGIAAYIGCDTTVVRLIALLLLFFGGASVWVYIILWIVMPAALTARQKLEMRGEPITISSIKDYYNSAAQSEQSRSIIASIISVIGRIFMILLKIIMAIVLFSLILALIAVAIAIFTAIITGGIVASGSYWGVIALASVALISIAVFIGLGIYVTLQLLNSRELRGRAIVTMLIIWLMLSASVATIAAFNGVNIRQGVKELRESIHNGKLSVSVNQIDELS